MRVCFFRSCATRAEHLPARHGGHVNRTPCLLAALLCLVACGRSETLPPVTAGVPAPTAGASVSDDPVREELRRIHNACEGRREALIDDIDDARRRVRRISGAAAVAWFLGEVLSGGDSSLAAGSDPTSDRCDPAGGAGTGRSECDPQALGTLQGRQRQSPAVQERRTVELDAAAQIRAINRASDEVDTLLFANPDPSTWTEAERQRWEQLHEILQQLCD